MSIHLPMGRALLWHRIARMDIIYSLGRQTYRKLPPLKSAPTVVHDVRRFSGGHHKRNTDECQKSTRIQGVLGRRRPLSPLERISRLLPQDAISPEVEQLRDGTQETTDERMDVIEESSVLVASGTVHNTKNEHTGAKTHIIEASVSQDEMANVSDGADGLERHGCGTCSDTFESAPTSLPRERSVEFGELMIAEYRRKNRVEFRKMFTLQQGARLHSSWGSINHDDIAGQPSGRFVRTTNWIPIFMRRASLEDYVVYMKRGPAIAYPKDASTMLTMMDVCEGDVVLESGSGSGAMTLFLSRAVGSKGTVFSVEIRDDHHRRAVKNYHRWRESWRLRRGEDWPDNVQFHKADLRDASPLLAGLGFHSFALDLISPQLVLPTIIPHLHPGAMCAVYLANITQVVDLLEGLRCSSLPLLCERIIEAPVRDWLVTPARQKDGDFCTRKPPLINADQTQEKSGEEENGESPPFGSVPYISRPHPEQLSHTAFLVKLRKYAQ